MLNNNKKYDIPKSLVKIQRDYIEKILNSVKGLKCLVLDNETSRIVSLIYLQSEAFNHETFLFEKIDNLGEDKLNYLNSIFIISSKIDNLNILFNELKAPKFKEYHIFFTTNISDEFIRKIAEMDEFDVIKSIQRIYFQYFSANDDLFHLDLMSTKSLNKRFDLLENYEKQLINSMEEGILNVILSLRKTPFIRYLNGSTICKHLSDKINNHLKKLEVIFPNEFDKNPSNLIIIERKEDPFTPLSINWSYQSLLHELITINYNSIELGNNNYNLFSLQDEFYKKNQNSIFGELASNLKENLEEISKKKNSQVKIKEFDDMQRLLNEMPEMKKASANISKHINLTGELNKIINKRNLMDLSKLEQNILTKDDKKVFAKELVDFLNNPEIEIYDKMRLVIIFCLRFEGDDKAREILNKFKQNIDEKLSQTIDSVLSYFSKNKRNLNLFNTGFTSKAKNYFKEVFNNVPNVYEQHVPYIRTLFEDIQNGRTKESDFSFLDAAPNRENPSTIIIFIIGGVTYSEAKEVADLNKKYPNINFVLGGTHLLNSKIFLSDFMET